MYASTDGASAKRVFTKTLKSFSASQFVSGEARPKMLKPYFLLIVSFFQIPIYQGKSPVQKPSVIPHRLVLIIITAHTHAPVQSERQMQGMDASRKVSL